ncbi:hypothetical protein EDB80DRAFT_811016 [Ilyonectria destructans]|nr:hypothetical protein EDB80DRAFT_811016 [Ilyonectria destructans]
MPLWPAPGTLTWQPLLASHAGSIPLHTNISDFVGAAHAQCDVVAHPHNRPCDPVPNRGSLLRCGLRSVACRSRAIKNKLGSQAVAVCSPGGGTAWMSDISRAADDLVMQGDDDPADRMLSMNRGRAMLGWDGTSEVWKGREAVSLRCPGGPPRPQSPFAARKTPSPSIEYVRSTTNDGYPFAFAPAGRLIPARPRLSGVERPSVCNPNQSIMQPRKHTGKETEGKEKEKKGNRKTPENAHLLDAFEETPSPYLSSFA